ncbi:MAG: hypothetical protein JXP34_18405 [Planctomycetes bacterium]|nr:hypothetical protein [Planctomycetota bacterium]
MHVPGERRTGSPPIHPLAPRPRWWRFWIWNACGAGGLGLAASLAGLALAPFAKMGLARLEEASEGSSIGLFLKLHDALWLPSLGVNAFNVLASAGLLVGALLCMGRRRSGVPVLGAAAIASIAYEGFKGWFLIRFWSLAVTALAEQTAKEVGGMSPEEVAEMVTPMMAVGCAVFVVFGLLLVAFYAGLALYVRGPVARAYIETGIRVTPAAAPPGRGPRARP